MIHRGPIGALPSRPPMKFACGQGPGLFKKTSELCKGTDCEGVRLQVQVDDHGLGDHPTSTSRR